MHIGARCKQQRQREVLSVATVGFDYVAMETGFELETADRCRRFASVRCSILSVAYRNLSIPTRRARYL